MPKPRNYPVIGLTLTEAKELIKKLNNLGGKSKIGIFAESIHMTETSGPFRSKLSTLAKYKLIEYGSGEVELTKLGTDLINPYDEEEEKELLLQAIKSIELFENIFQRFSGLKLDMNLFEKILIREYDVDKKHVLGLKKIFLDFTETYGLLHENGTIKKLPKQKESEEEKMIKKSNIKYIRKDDGETDSPRGDKQKLSKNLFNTITYLASYFSPEQKQLREIVEFIESNPDLTHLNLLFKVLKDKFINQEISTEEIGFLLKAIREDLSIT